MRVNLVVNHLTKGHIIGKAYTLHNQVITDITVTIINITVQEKKTLTLTHFKHPVHHKKLAEGSQKKELWVGRALQYFWDELLGRLPLLGKRFRAMNSSDCKKVRPCHL